MKISNLGPAYLPGGSGNEFRLAPESDEEKAFLDELWAALSENEGRVVRVKTESAPLLDLKPGPSTNVERLEGLEKDAPEEKDGETKQANGYGIALLFDLAASSPRQPTARDGAACKSPCDPGEMWRAAADRHRKPRSSSLLARLLAVGVMVAAAFYAGYRYGRYKTFSELAEIFLTPSTHSDVERNRHP